MGNAIINENVRKQMLNYYEELLLTTNKIIITHEHEHIEVVKRRKVKTIEINKYIFEYKFDEIKKEKESVIAKGRELVVNINNTGNVYLSVYSNDNEIMKNEIIYYDSTGTFTFSGVITTRLSF